MLKFKTLEILAWSFALFTMPCMANEQPLDAAQNLSGDQSNIVQNAERSRNCCDHHSKRSNKIKPLKLADFAGDWVIGVDSIGGLEAVCKNLYISDIIYSNE